MHWLTMADGIEVERHPEENEDCQTPEFSIYLHARHGGRYWIADFEIGTNDDQFTDEQARDCAYDYAEQLLEKHPQLRAHGINNSNS